MLNDGIVIWFNDKLGYGFITSNDKEVFVHYSQILSKVENKSLKKGDKVSFDLYEDDTHLGRYLAKNVNKINC